MSRFLIAQAGVVLAMAAFAPLPAAAQHNPNMDVRDDNARPVHRGTTRSVGRERRSEPPVRSAEEIAAAASQALAGAGASCSVTTAREIGESTEGGSVMEAACATGPGFVVVSSTPPVAFNCLTAAAQAQQALAADPAAAPFRCELPENQDALAAVTPWVQALNVSCVVDQAKWLGRTTSNADRYEVGCSSAGGYWIEVSADGTPTSAVSCLRVPAAAGRCEFTTDQEAAAGIQAQLAGSPAADCDARQARYMGSNDNGSFYELKCASGAGEVVRLNAAGEFQQAYDCAQAANVGEGCQLTDGAAVAASQDDDRVARMAALGQSCSVTDQRVIGNEGGGAQREVVEFACSDSPLGVVALLAPDAQGSEAMDCLTAYSRNLTCQFTTDDQIKAVMGQMLQAANSNCVVTDYRIVGLMDARDGQVVEVKCEAGSGYFAEFPNSRGQAGRVQSCSQAAAVGDRCEL